MKMALGWLWGGSNCATFYINLFDANLRLRRDIGDELIQKAILNT